VWLSAILQSQGTRLHSGFTASCVFDSSRTINDTLLRGLYPTAKKTDPFSKYMIIPQGNKTSWYFVVIG
jgi:hypothetical protein